MNCHAARALLSLLTLGAIVAATPGGPAHAGTSGTDATRHAVVRPVTASGRPAPGYSVHREMGQHDGAVDCYDQAPWARSAGIDLCYPTAVYVPSCWKSTNHTALCLRDVDKKALVRVRYSGRFPSHAALPGRKRTPQGLVLGNGEHCNIRIGGAWGPAPGHPSWVGFYSCGHGSLWGGGDRDGIDRSGATWRVHELRNDNTWVTRRVKKATYVATLG